MFRLPPDEPVPVFHRHRSAAPVMVLDRSYTDQLCRPLESSGQNGPGARPHRVARRGAVRHPVRLAVPALHVDRVALSRRLRARRHPHVARRPARRMVHVVEAIFYAVLMIPVSLAPWRLGVTNAFYAIPATAARPGVSRVHAPLRAHPARQDRRRKPHVSPRSAQGERALLAAAVHHAHALREGEGVAVR